MYKEALPYEDRLPSTSHNSGYMVPLRFTQIFAPLRSAKTSYSRGTLCAISLLKRNSLNRYTITDILIGECLAFKIDGDVIILGVEFF